MRGMSDEEWDDVIATNLTSCFVCCRAAAGIMRRAKYGRIINMASISGLMGNPGQANYSASKAGMIGLTRTLSKELVNRGVTVNAVAPGFIASEMTAELGDVVLEEAKKRIPAKRIGRAGGDGRSRAVSWPPRTQVTSRDRLWWWTAE